MGLPFEGDKISISLDSEYINNVYWITDTGYWKWVVHQTSPETIENQSKVHLLDIKKAPQSAPLEPIWPQLGPHGLKAHF